MFIFFTFGVASWFNRSLLYCLGIDGTRHKSIGVIRSSSVRIGRVGYDFAFLYTDKLLIFKTKIFEIKKSQIFFHLELHCNRFVYTPESTGSMCFFGISRVKFGGLDMKIGKTYKFIKIDSFTWVALCMSESRKSGPSEWEERRDLQLFYFEDIIELAIYMALVKKFF